MKNILEISKDLKFKSPKKDAEFIFDKNNTGISKNIFIDKDSKLQKTTHYYNNHRCDGIWWYANHKTFQNLSLLLFASLFCEKYPHIEITFSHSQSEIKTFIIPTIASTKKQKNFFLVTKPLSYTYIRQQCLKHPWMQQSRTSPAEFPVFSLLENKEKHHRSNYETLHTLKLQNTSTYQNIATAKLAALLLDFSLDKTHTGEIQLESESGFRGVGVSSLEMSFFNPDSEIF